MIERNSILQGDCLEKMKLIADKSIDMILCDLPYGTTNCKWDVVIPFEPLWKEYWRIIKDNGAIVLTAQQPFATDLINSFRKYFRYEIIWEKTQKLGFGNCNKMPLRGHENILVFYKKLPTYNPQKRFEPNAQIGRTRGRQKDRYRGYSNFNTREEYIDTGWRFPHSVVKISNWNGGGVWVMIKLKQPSTPRKSQCRYSPGSFAPTQTPATWFWTIAAAAAQRLLAVSRKAVTIFSSNRRMNTINTVLSVSNLNFYKQHNNYGKIYTGCRL